MSLNHFCLRQLAPEPSVSGGRSIPSPSQTLGSEPLVNCWIREGGKIEESGTNTLFIPLQNETRLEVRFLNRTLLGDVRLLEPVLCRGRHLSALELADLLAREFSPPKELSSDWRENLESSLRVQEQILESVSKNGQPLNFLTSEQSLFLGHRFHPSPKSRLGFSQKDLETYSPEWGNSFPLHYFGLEADVCLKRGQYLFADSWAKKMQALFQTPLTVLPVHPWQARKALSDPAFQKLLQEKKVRDFGQAGPDFFPTSSVRTLYQPQWNIFVKTSLDVRITNCFRRNMPSEMETISHLRKLIPALDISTEKFQVLDEPLCLDLKIESPLYLGAIFREGVQDPLLSGALFGDSYFGVERCRANLRGDLETWFEEYCEALVPPVLDAFHLKGIMFEPHLQNILVCLHEGRPVKILQRDLDNAKIVKDSPASQFLEGLPDFVKKECLISQETGWKRLVYCLVVNHLAEAIATLARTQAGNPQAREKILWDVLRGVLQRLQNPMANRLLREKNLWAKRNMLTRFQRIPDKEAPFSPIPNPLFA